MLNHACIPRRISFNHVLLSFLYILGYKFLFFNNFCIYVHNIYSQYEMHHHLFLNFCNMSLFFSCHCFKISFYHWFLVIWLLCSFLSVLGNFWASWILICIFITFEKKVIIYWILCIFHLLYLEDSNSTYTQLCEGVPLFTNAFSYFTVLSLSISY